MGDIPYDTNDTRLMGLLCERFGPDKAAELFPLLTHPHVKALANEVNRIALENAIPRIVLKLPDEPVAFYRGPNPAPDGFYGDAPFAKKPDEPRE